MLERLELQHVGPATRLVLDLAPRLNVITGDNGLGKTFLLDVAFWALTRAWVGYPAAPHRGAESAPSIGFQYRGKSTPIEHTSVYNFEEQAWPSKPGRPADPGLVLYARVDGSFSVWDPARNYWKNAPTMGVTAPDRPPAYHFAFTEVWDGLERDGKHLCNGLISDLAFWQNGNNEPFRQLKDVLQALSPAATEILAPGELTRVSVDDVRPMPTLKTTYGQDVPVAYVSAGVKRILAMAYLLVWTWQEHVQASRLLKNPAPAREVIFLIDEIEAHLHPRWQRTILRSLLRVMATLTGTEDVKVQVLAVTHSPLVLASLEPLFDPNEDALWTMDVEGGRVELRQETWRRRGDANAWLVSDVFDLAEPRSLEAEQAIQRAEALMRRSDVERAEYEAAREELRSVLPGVDAFWVRWRFWATQSGFEP